MFRNPPQTAPPRDRRKGTDSSNSKGSTGGEAGEPHALVLSCSEFTSVTPHNSIIQNCTPGKLLNIREDACSNFGLKTISLECCLPWYSSVPQGKYRGSTSYYAVTASSRTCQFTVRLSHFNTTQCSVAVQKLITIILNQVSTECHSTCQPVKSTEQAHS